ncbi:MAG TPA: hypothetical protein VNQ74_15480, partial [Burkholderiaceae bacterium]|nr:hypothetical protein [Burkholderiaceae bacterium]
MNQQATADRKSAELPIKFCRTIDLQVDCLGSERRGRIQSLRPQQNDTAVGVVQRRLDAGASENVVELCTTRW